MEKIIKIKGHYGQTMFFDDEDRQNFRWACSLLPYHMKNDLRTYERCGIAKRIDMSSETEAVLSVDAWDWTHDQIAKFLCLCYDSYYRRKYNRSGKQTDYQLY